MLHMQSRRVRRASHRIAMAPILQGKGGNNHAYNDAPLAAVTRSGGHHMGMGMACACAHACRHGSLLLPLPHALREGLAPHLQAFGALGAQHLLHHALRATGQGSASAAQRTA